MQCNRSTNNVKKENIRCLKILAKQLFHVAFVMAKLSKSVILDSWNLCAGKFDPPHITINFVRRTCLCAVVQFHLTQWGKQHGRYARFDVMNALLTQYLSLTYQIFKGQVFELADQILYKSGQGIRPKSPFFCLFMGK